MTPSLCETGSRHYGADSLVRMPNARCVSPDWQKSAMRYGLLSLTSCGTASMNCGHASVLSTTASSIFITVKPLLCWYTQ